MPNITYLECRLTGHQSMCEQEATLLPDGGGTLDHKHICIRCGHVHRFETEDLPPEVEQALRMTMPPSQFATSVLLHDPLMPTH